MTAVAMLHNLRSQGFSIQSESGDLKIKAKRGLITEENKAQLVKFKPDLLALFAAGNDTCDGIVHNDAGEGWRHSWCSASCFDNWEAAEGWLLTVFEPGTGEARMRVGELLAIRHCPDGCGQMTEQDSIHDVWYCPVCDLWVVAGKVILLRA